MATDILVPTLGESITEATVAQWLKRPGEAVTADEPLVELETDKVTLEVNASTAGVLSEVVAAAGEGGVLSPEFRHLRSSGSRPILGDGGS